MNVRDERGRTVRVQRLIGRNPGEVVEMSFVAARNAIRAGFAVPAPGEEVPPAIQNETVSPPVAATLEAPEVVTSSVATSDPVIRRAAARPVRG